MAGFRTELARNLNLALGSSSFGPFLIDNDVKRIGISFTRGNWTDPVQRLDVSLEESVNNGPFKFMAGFVATGAPAPAPPRANITTLSVELSPGTGRRIQGTYTCTGQRIRTTITVEAFIS